MDIIISSLVGGIIGLIIGVLLEDPLTLIKQRTLQWMRKLVRRRPRALPQPGTFHFGKVATSFLVIDGDGEMAYTPETIRCRLEEAQLELPPEILNLRASIAARENSKKEQGLSSMWNGPLYALKRYAIGRSIPDENMEVTLTFQPSDYFTFLSTVLSLDADLSEQPGALSLRQKYLQHADLSQPIPFLANGFGVALVILTADAKMLFVRRQKTKGPRAGEIDVSVVEGLHPTLDRSSTFRGPDCYRTVIRGAQEELGIALVNDQILFLGFGVDTEYYQWNLIGVAHIPETAEEVLRQRSRGVGGTWELAHIEAVDANPKKVFTFLKKEKIWSTGCVATYWALVNEFGKGRVDKALEEVSG